MGMVVLGFAVPRWWIIAVAIAITLGLSWLWNATHVHVQLESGIKMWLLIVSSAAAGGAAGIGVLARRFGRPRPESRS
jgi:hypothetical protein